MVTKDLAARGAVAGFQVRSNLDFLYLRDGGGDPLEVREADLGPPPEDEPLVRWLARPNNPFEASLYPTELGYRMWIPGMGSFGIDVPEPRITVPPGVDPSRREARLWGVPASILASARGDLPLHASAVDVDGRALVFCGPSRFGKTTLAAAFLAAGYRVLAEDLTICRPGPSPEVLPGPALLRLRLDVYERLGPFTSTIVAAQDDDRVHLAIHEGRGSGAPVRLAAVVVLRRGSSDVQLYRVRPEPFLAELFSMSFCLPTDEDRSRSFAAAAGLAGSAPIWVLDRPLRFELIGEVVDRLVRSCLG